MVYTLRFFSPLQNVVCFIILMYLVPVLFTYTQGVLKLKKTISGPKMLMLCSLFWEIRRRLMLRVDVPKRSV